jgi:tight adherence protein C
MVLLSSLSAALTVFAGIFAMIGRSRPRRIEGRLEAYDRGARPGREAAMALPFSRRVGWPFLQRVSALAKRLLPASVVATVERQLVLAGDPLSLFAYLAAVIAFLAAAVMVVVAGLSLDTTRTARVAIVAAAVLVAVAPAYWLRTRVVARSRAILRALPDAVDLIVTTVEAGLGIDAALADVGHQIQGPLGEELRLAIRETALGRSRRDALQRLAERTRVSELKTFVQSVIQAEETGIPIGQVLRAQAAQVRLRKRQRAEAEAQRAPVKMVLVLVTLVLPSMLLLVVGPAVMRMRDMI